MKSWVVDLVTVRSSCNGGADAESLTAAQMDSLGLGIRNSRKLTITVIVSACHRPSLYGPWSNKWVIQGHDNYAVTRRTRNSHIGAPERSLETPQFAFVTPLRYPLDRTHWSSGKEAVPLSQGRGKGATEQRRNWSGLPTSHEHRSQLPGSTT